MLVCFLIRFSLFVSIKLLEYAHNDLIVAKLTYEPDDIYQIVIN